MANLYTPCYGRKIALVFWLSTIALLSSSVPSLANPTGIVEKTEVHAFAFTKSLVIHANKIPGTNVLSNFPLMVDITSADFATLANGGKVENANGYDIGFSDASDNPIDFQIERYDPVNGRIIAWVNVPSIDPIVDTEIKILYGDASVVADPSSPSAFSACYQGRYHMNSDPSSVAPQLSDATSNGLNASALGTMDATDLVEGIVGFANEFDGVDDKYEMGTSVAPGANFTISAWIKSDQADAGFHGFLGFDAGGVTNRSPSMWVYQNYRIHYGYGGGGAWNNNNTPVDQALVTSNTDWHYVVTSYDGTNYNCYIDGELAQSFVPANAPNGNGINNIGGLTNYFRGQIDEVSIANCVLSEDWLEAEYNNIIDPSSFYTLEPGIPNLDIVSPSNGSQYFNTNVIVRYDRTGNQAGVYKVKATVDGVDTFFDTDLDGELTLSGLALGNRSVVVELLDDTDTPLGNPEATESFSVEVVEVVNSLNFAKILTIQESEAIGTSPHTDFPVLISHTDPDLKHTSFGGKVQNINGYDIGFFTAGGIRLDHQIERYNPETGEIVMWVRIPSLDPTVDTEIKLGYGNPGITENNSTNTTFSSCYAGRWHLDADPASSGPQLQDATANDTDGTASFSMLDTDKVGGIIGYATQFDGSDDFYTLGAGVLANSEFTMSAWVSSDQLPSSGNWHGFFGGSPGATNQRAPSMWIYGDALSPTYSGIHGGFGDGNIWNSWATGGGFISNDGTTWHYVVTTFDGALYNCYVDGVLAFSKVNPAGSAPFNTPVLYIGKVDNYFRGRIDEASISDCVFNQDWIQTEYNNQISPTTFYTIGTEEAFPVEWLDVKAELEGREVNISWKTASEQNNDYFTVEKSLDGERFDEIQRIAGKGNSTTISSYEATDAKAQTGWNYYRIRQTDIDGQFSHSNVVKIWVNEQLQVGVFPNPAQNVLTVETIGNKEAAKIQVYSVLGQEIPVQLSTTELSNGMRYELNLDKASSGLYFVQITQGGKRKQIHFQVKK
ncbi:MAG: DUF2341 domain-containing protein [Bacteroidota bacterium]